MLRIEFAIALTSEPPNAHPALFLHSMFDVLLFVLLQMGPLEEGTRLLLQTPGRIYVQFRTCSCIICRALPRRSIGRLTPTNLPSGSPCTFATSPWPHQDWEIETSLRWPMSICALFAWCVNPFSRGHDLQVSHTFKG